jgi:hypothetical protein
MTRINIRCFKVFSLSIVLFIGCDIAIVNGCAQPATRTASSAEAGQARTDGSNEGKTAPAIQKDWKIVAAPIADLMLTLPAELSEGASISEPKKYGDVTWTDYSYEWKTQGDKRDLALDVYVLVSITNWDNGFPAELGGGSPEAILERRYAGTEANKKSGKIEELTLLEVDGVKGIFFREPESLDKNRIQLYWSTYRYHKTKAQHLSILIHGVRSDSDALMKIISSARLVQK